MVPTDQDTCINAPLAQVQRLFEENWRPEMPVEHTWGVPEYFNALYDTEEKRDRIPSLNTLPTSEWRPGTLVRFRCMVQDTSFGQEIAVDAVCSSDGQTWKSYRYSDGTSNESDDATSTSDTAVNVDALYAGQDRVRLNELQLLYCVSIPGETEWARRQYNEKMTARWGYDPLIPSSNDTTASNNLNAHSSKLAIKHPIEEEASYSCGVIVKILGNADDIKVTDTVEFIGVYSQAPVINDDLLSVGSGTGAIEYSPCIHAIVHRVLHSDAETPLRVSRCLDKTGHLTTTDDINPRDIAIESRQRILDDFTQLLNGDSLAAEYMLLALISRVQHRVNTTTVGNLTLNLTKIPASSASSNEVRTSDNDISRLYSTLARRVHHRLTDLVSKCVTLPMSLHCLNHRPFWPRDTGSGVEKLASGRLQLSAGTCLLIDETALDEGKLEDTGVRNVRALARVVETQQLDYAFPYRGEISFPTNLNLLIFSTARSMLPAEFVLPLQLNSTTDNATTDADANAVDEECLQQWRMYLVITRVLAHEIPETLSQQIQQDFVDRRRANTEQAMPVMTDAELSRELLVARLIAQSYGEEKLNETHWQQAKSMESERRARLTFV
ncbi:mini-chromosome maintenance replisome factor-domain-containing protein [Syncephalis plumigaleata]|nr:mini-chromosome maintenance replisome factor-domain-containing protein [Syncephalis plumigaleata]